MSFSPPRRHPQFNVIFYQRNSCVALCLEMDVEVTSSAGVRGGI
jgi:hypothetical protein